MKKSYLIPYTEVVDLRIQEKITFGEGANQSNDAQYGSGKEHTFIFEEFEEEEPDTTSFWNSDPWKIKYSLWDED